MRNSKGQFIKGSIPWTQGIKIEDYPKFKNHLDKIHAERRGKPSWNKGLKTSGMKGKKHTEETKKKMSAWQIGGRLSEEHKRKLKERKKYISLETRKKISSARKGKYIGENSPFWIKDRNKLAKRQKRNDMAYKEWHKQVLLRDNFKCKIKNKDCEGRLEVHHILAWSSYPKLRYQINNGITLCHAHHPRKRSDEAKLSPFFQKLVAEMN